MNKDIPRNAGKPVCKKVYYGSKKAAEDAILNIVSTSHRKKIPTRAYKCAKCKSWHLTSQDTPEHKSQIIMKSENLELKNKIQTEQKQKQKSVEVVKQEIENQLKLNFNEKIAEVKEQLRKKVAENTKLRRQISVMQAELCQLKKFPVKVKYEDS